MTRNDLLMEFQADILRSPVAAPSVAEITATGHGLRGGIGDRILVRAGRAACELHDHAALAAVDGRRRTRAWHPALAAGIDRTYGLAEPSLTAMEAV